MCLFFFSSRRRHTRFDCDWSSDVCSSDLLAGELGRLAGRSPPNPVPPLTAYPGEPKDILPRADAGHPPELIERAFLTLSCRGDTVAARWLDAYPGRLTPADTLVLRIEAYSDREWHPVAWDDDPYVEVRAVKPQGKRNVAG